MYFKIENKACEVYKKLFDMRKLEHQMEIDNIEIVKEKAGQDFDGYFGHRGQQNWNRVTVYSGFEFLEPKKLNMKIWKPHKDHAKTFVPNRRTKLGREMDKLLSNGLKGHVYTIVYDNLGLKHPVGKHFLPFVEIVKNNTLILSLDERQSLPNNENVIEITSKEFKELHSTLLPDKQKA